MSERTNRRGHFRLRYPPGAGPVFVTDGVACAVVELSERGLQFVARDQQPGAGRPMAGVLRFADGTELAVGGTVSRFVAGRVAVRLTRGVSLGRMLAEQRRIIRAYPDFLCPAERE